MVGMVEARGTFYAEWNDRGPGETRDVSRAGELAELLGVRPPRTPVLTVVGSKGKGTTATYASAWLAAAAVRVVTVTSPSLRSDTERIRVNGTAVSVEELRGLAGRLETAMKSLPRRREGYLSPSGLFTLAGLLHADTIAADAVVLEAGMGGASDEAGLFPPAVVAITEIFAEHVGVLGDTPAEIAADKAAVATPATSAILTLPQTSPVTTAINTTLATRTTTRPEIITRDLPTTIDSHIRSGTTRRPEGHVRPATTPVTPEGHGRPGTIAPQPPAATARPQPGPITYMLPAIGLSRPNAELGCAAGARMLTALGLRQPPAGHLADVLASVVLPGRSTRHDVHGTATRVLVDSAIDRTGATAALAEAYRVWGQVDHVLVCLPDHKDVSRCRRAARRAAGDLHQDA